MTTRGTGNDRLRKFGVAPRGRSGTTPNFYDVTGDKRNDDELGGETAFRADSPPSLRRTTALLNYFCQKIV